MLSRSKIGVLVPMRPLMFCLIVLSLLLIVGQTPSEAVIVQVDFGAGNGSNGTTTEGGTVWNAAEPGNSGVNLPAGGSSSFAGLVDSSGSATSIDLTLDWSNQAGIDFSRAWDLHSGDRDGDYIGIRGDNANVFNVATLSGLTPGNPYDVTVWANAPTDFRVNTGSVERIPGMTNGSVFNTALSHTFTNTQADSSGDIILDWGHITNNPPANTWASMTAMAIATPGESPPLVVDPSAIQIDFGAIGGGGNNYTTIEGGTAWNGIEPGSSGANQPAGGSSGPYALVDSDGNPTAASLTLNWSNQADFSRAWDLSPGNRDGDHLGIKGDNAGVFNTAALSGLPVGAGYDVTVWTNASTDFRVNAGSVERVDGVTNISAANCAQPYTFRDMTVDSNGEILLDWGHITNDPPASTWASMTAMAITTPVAPLPAPVIIQVDFGAGNGNNGTTSEDGTVWNGVEPGNSGTNLTPGGGSGPYSLVDSNGKPTDVDLILDWSDQAGLDFSRSWDLMPGDRDGDYLGIKGDNPGVFNVATLSGLIPGDMYDVTVWSNAPTDFRINDGSVETILGVGNSSTINEALSFTFEKMLVDANGNIIIDWGHITSARGANQWASMTALSIHRIPEPSTFILSAIGILGFGFLLRCRKRCVGRFSTS